MHTGQSHDFRNDSMRQSGLIIQVTGVVPAGMGIFEAGARGAGGTKVIGQRIEAISDELWTDEGAGKRSRTLKDSLFKMSSMDPSDSVYDEFYPQARAIQSASLVIASLVRKDNVAWEQHNSHVALLVGFAVGLGKQVLVLQQQPIAPILDLGSLSRPIDTESQAERIVKSWIEAQARIAINQTVETRRLARTRQAADRMRGLYLGHPDALQDSRLLDYFVPTKEFEDAIEGHRTIFIGRRGSGKSANFQAIREELRDNSSTLTVEIAPDDFELERIAGFLKDGHAVANQGFAFRSAWNYILITEILKSLGEKSDKLYLSPDDSIRSNLHQYCVDNHSMLNLDFGARVISMLSHMASSTPSAQGQGNLTIADERIDTLRDYQISRQLKEFAIREGMTFFVVADDLDKHWRPDTRQSIDLLLALIAEADRQQRFFEGHLQVVLFLREDIYDVLAQYDEDLPKRSFLRMEWTKANLKHLVAERLAHEVDQENDDDDATWSAIFPDNVKGISATDYILSRALPRPRDVLDFCQKSIDQAQRNGHSGVTEQDILDGEVSFSEGLFSSVCTEFRGLYPGLEEVLIEFAGVSEKMSWDDFGQLADESIRVHKAIIEDWGRSGKVSSRELADVLFAVGVIGLSRGVGDTPYFRNGRSFAETWILCSPKPVVHIHPGFARALDISGAGLRPFKRVRARRSVDPRQLAFDQPP